MKFNTRILGIEKETHDVISLWLEKPENFSFVSGQFCLLKLIDSQKFKGEDRPFTFSNSPTEKRLRLTIKIAGEFTRVIEKLKQGDGLNLTAPLGQDLSFDDGIKDDIVFISGGSGITPFMSSIRYAIDKNMTNNITLIYSNRTEADIIFRKYFDSIKYTNISIVHTLTNDVPKTWQGETGFIDENMVRKHVNEPLSRLWFICGPPPMTKAMKDMLKNMGVKGKRIRIEPWELPGKKR